MADIYCCHFEYGGVSSRTYGLHFVNVETERFINVQGEISGVNIFNKRSKRNYLIDTDYTSSPVSYDIDIVTDDERTLTKLEQEEIERWLFNRANNMKLYIDPEDDYDCGTYDKYMIVTSRPSVGEVGVVYLVLRSGTTYTAQMWNGSAYESLPNISLSGTTMTESSGSPTITSTFSRMSGNQNILAAHKRYLRCRFINPSKLEYNGGVVGYKATLEADSGWWWQDPITAAFTLNHASATSNSMISITPDTDVDDYIYPKVTITAGNISGYQGSTTPNLYIPSASSSSPALMFRCAVSNSDGTEYSKAVQLITGTAPYIAVQPTNVTADVGEPITLSIVAVGEGLTYQWQWHASGQSTWLNCSGDGSNGPDYTFEMSADRAGSSYRCIVLDVSDTQRTSNVITITRNVYQSDTGYDYGYPIIRKQPENVTARDGDRVSFSVSVYGTGVTYQWQVSKNNGSTWKNCTSSGSNSSMFGFVTAASYSGWRYRCIVTRTSSKVVDPATGEIETVDLSTTSNVAIMTVYGDNRPLVSKQPSTAYVAVGKEMYFNAEADKDDATYTWQVSLNNGSSWSNITSNDIILVNETDNTSRTTTLTNVPASTSVVLDGETNYVSNGYYSLLKSRHFPRVLPFRTNTFMVSGVVNTVTFEYTNRRNL